MKPAGAAPSPKRRRIKFAKRKATIKAAIAGATPKQNAMVISRINPEMRLRKVPEKKRKVDLETERKERWDPEFCSMASSLFIYDGFKIKFLKISFIEIRKPCLGSIKLNCILRTMIFSSSVKMIL